MPTVTALRQAVARSARSLPGVRHLLELARRNSPVVSDGQVAQYHHDGYMVFDPGLPEAVLDRAVADLLTRPEFAHDRHHGSRVFDGWKVSRAVRAIALAPRVLRLLGQLYGRRPRPFQTLNFPIGTEQKVHSDAIHFASDPPTYMCGVWVALEDIDLRNGPLVYYPGSHKLPVVTMEDVAPGPGPEHYPLYEAYIEKLVRDKNLTPHHAVLRKGQALIWASNLLHGGSVHRDKGRTRHSQVTHYFFAGCQYYQPLSSYGGYRHLKLDDWVR
ncbi:MAG: phytanoyl-CoA dioxygenase family protein [Gemmataceae bacterium]|nr:phytanoyl-CoA dioxygenase family protein [Gemmataceae bacterium]